MKCCHPACSCTIQSMKVMQVRELLPASPSRHPLYPRAFAKTKSHMLVDFTFPEVTGRKLLLPSSKPQTFFISVAQLVKFPPSPLCIASHPLFQTKEYFMLDYFRRGYRRTKQWREDHRPRMKLKAGQEALVSETGAKKGREPPQGPLSTECGGRSGIFLKTLGKQPHGNAVSEIESVNVEL